MIAKLYGRIDETGVDHLVIDVNGVGYLVQASARTLSALGKTDDFATVFTEMQVSENDMRLIGFATREERDWFRLLTGVQGVGGKVGLAILSAIEPADLALAIGSGDAAMVARANGVGPKLASRIVNELKDKVGALAGISGGAKLMATGAANGSHAQDAMSALANLGFKPGEAGTAVAQAVEELGPDATLDALVRLALKRASRCSAPPPKTVTLNLFQGPSGNYSCAIVGKPSPTARSTQCGFSELIRFIFQARCQFFSCFSRAIAVSIVLKTSQCTSR